MRCRIVQKKMTRFSLISITEELWRHRNDTNNVPKKFNGLKVFNI